MGDVDKIHRIDPAVFNPVPNRVHESGERQQPKKEKEHHQPEDSIELSVELEEEAAEQNPEEPPKKKPDDDDESPRLDIAI